MKHIIFLLLLTFIAFIGNCKTAIVNQLLFLLNSDGDSNVAELCRMTPDKNDKYIYNVVIPETIEVDGITYTVKVIHTYGLIFASRIEVPKTVVYLGGFGSSIRGAYPSEVVMQEGLKAVGNGCNFDYK